MSNPNRLKPVVPVNSTNVTDDEKARIKAYEAEQASLPLTERDAPTSPMPYRAATPRPVPADPNNITPDERARMKAYDEGQANRPVTPRPTPADPANPTTKEAAAMKAYDANAGKQGPVVCKDPSRPTDIELEQMKAYAAAQEGVKNVTAADTKKIDDLRAQANALNTQANALATPQIGSPVRQLADMIDQKGMSAPRYPEQVQRDRIASMTGVSERDRAGNLTDGSYLVDNNPNPNPFNATTESGQDAEFIRNRARNTRTRKEAGMPSLENPDREKM